MKQSVPLPALRARLLPPVFERPIAGNVPAKRADAVTQGPALRPVIRQELDRVPDIDTRQMLADFVVAAPVMNLDQASDSSVIADLDAVLEQADHEGRIDADPGHDGKA